MTNQALLIIDYTNDFVADSGALTCGQPGQLLAPTITELAQQAQQAGDWVLLPTDVHTPDDPYHPESRLFPTHNVAGTWGMSSMARSKTGLIKTSRQIMSGNSLRPATAPLPVLTLICAYANAVSIR
ncbi:putative isochorismatase family protein pncA [Levilactobacillus brevis]|nr:putative isochorismatase family protein pncA [Levilactobacillus brevis]